MLFAVSFFLLNTAVLYEILYKEVFKVPKEADQAVDILRESASEPAEMVNDKLL